MAINRSEDARANTRLREILQTFLETMMSAPVDATARRDSIVAGLGTQLRAAIRRVLAAYLARRDEEAAIAHLSKMSDRELRDIGLSRSEIPFAVRRRVPRDRAVRSYL